MVLTPLIGALLLTHYGLILPYLGVLDGMKVGWKRCSALTTGVNFVGKLSKCLWYIDPHHHKFASRGMKIPTRFESFQGYNDFKKHKKKEPRISSAEINVHVHELSGCLMQPWFSLPRTKKRCGGSGGCPQDVQ